MTNPISQPVPPVHAAESVTNTNKIDAFTEFINQWVDTNMKVFTRKENQP